MNTSGITGSCSSPLLSQNKPENSVRAPETSEEVRTVFNARQVSRTEGQPKLTIYLDDVYGHAFVGLKDKKRGIDILRGFYADGLRVSHNLPTSGLYYYTLPGSAIMSSGYPASHATLISTACGITVGLLFASLPGKVVDETEEYKNYGGTDHVPSVSFSISDSESLEIERYIADLSLDCKERRNNCVYRTLGANCVDFASKVFSLTNHSNEFIDHFPSRVPLSLSDHARAYASFSALPYSVKSVSLAGTAMLAVSLGYAATKAARSLFRFASQLVWPGSTPEKVIDERDFKECYESVEGSVLDTEKPSRVNAAGMHPDSSLVIDRIIDLQSRFDDVQKIIRKKGVEGSHQAYIYNELKALQQEFKVLNEELDPLESELANQRKSASP